MKFSTIKKLNWFCNFKKFWKQKIRIQIGRDMINYGGKSITNGIKINCMILKN